MTDSNEYYRAWAIASRICLDVFDIERRTKCGLWLKYRHTTEYPMLSGLPFNSGAFKNSHIANAKYSKPFYIRAGSKSAYAKPTQDEALKSMVARTAKKVKMLAMELRNAEEDYIEMVTQFPEARDPDYELELDLRYPLRPHLREFGQ